MKPVPFSGSWTLTVVPHQHYLAAVRESGEIVSSAALPPSGSSLDGTVTVPATVPGNFELDLHRAGLLPDPYFGTNILSLRALEDRHLFYATTFLCASPCRGTERRSIRFHGLDTFADIFVNGVRIGRADNALIEHAFEIPVGVLQPGDNELFVHIRPTMVEAQREGLLLPPSALTYKYNFASLAVRKAPSSFGWDILCRSVSGGLWRGVTLEAVESAPRLNEAFLYTKRMFPESGYAEINLYFAFETPDGELANDYAIEVEGRCGDALFRQRQDVWHTSGTMTLILRDARFWYPRNAGPQNLYNVHVTLLRGGQAVSEKTFRAGIRKVELDRTSLVTDGEGQFRFRVNDKPVFLMGANWVPLDAFHSRDAERLPKALELLLDSGCNCVRCWGGNVYEDHAFFDFCDEHGIFVWQDFAMGCSCYPQTEHMKEALAHEALAIVRKLRNHVSLCVWAGDNECDQCWQDGWFAPSRNPGDNELTRVTLARVLRDEDFTRPYLPSSPYIDEVAAAAHSFLTPENHLWGPRDYFKGNYYRTASCSFASETGYSGCPAPETLRTFISEEELWPIFREAGSIPGGLPPGHSHPDIPGPSWLAHQTGSELNETNPHGYRIRLMASQVAHMFRDAPATLADFARMSQCSQAEAFKYFIERFRVGKPRRTGIIWWNLLDGWPQVSEALVNYDLTRKLAYGFVKRAQAPVLLAFDDPDPATGVAVLHGINDTQCEVRIVWRVAECPVPEGLPSGNLLEGTATLPPDGNLPLGELAFAGREERVLAIAWSCESDASLSGTSHYIAAPKALDSAEYLGALNMLGFDDFIGFDEK